MSERDYAGSVMDFTPLVRLMRERKWTTQEAYDYAMGKTTASQKAANYDAGAAHGRIRAEQARLRLKLLAITAPKTKKALVSSNTCRGRPSSALGNAGGQPCSLARPAPTPTARLDTSRNEATWLRLTQRRETPPQAITWLNSDEAVLFSGRDIADLQRVGSLNTKRERSGSRTTIFYDAADLQQAFGIRDAAMKLALMECSMYQLRREFANSTNAALTPWVADLMRLRSRSG